MDVEAKVLRMKMPEELVECHLRLPNFTREIRDTDDPSSGMASLASIFQGISDRFEILSEIFAECGRAGYSPDSHFIDGCLTFIFHVPRRFVPRLLDEGWSENEVDL